MRIADQLIDLINGGTANPSRWEIPSWRSISHWSIKVGQIAKATIQEYPPWLDTKYREGRLKQSQEVDSKVRRG